MCLANRDLLADVRVVAGQFDQREENEEEQILPLETVSVHEKYQLALVEVDQHI